MKYFGTKQPYEEYYVEFNFKNDLGTETASSATVTATLTTEGDSTTTITTAALQYLSTTSVFVWVKAGASGSSYKITAKVVGSAGSKYELEAMLPVLET